MTTPAASKKLAPTQIVLYVLYVLYGIVGLLVAAWVVEAATGDDLAADARAACRVLVEDRLRAPSTADFSGLTATQSGDRWTVKGAVDAQNGFGAQVRSNFTCVVEQDGSDWVLVRMSGLQ